MQKLKKKFHCRPLTSNNINILRESQWCKFFYWIYFFDAARDDSACSPLNTVSARFFLKFNIMFLVSFVFANHVHINFLSQHQSKNDQLNLLDIPIQYSVYIESWQGNSIFSNILDLFRIVNCFVNSLWSVLRFFVDKFRISYLQHSIQLIVDFFI